MRDKHEKFEAEISTGTLPSTNREEMQGVAVLMAEKHDMIKEGDIIEQIKFYTIITYGTNMGFSELSRILPNGYILKGEVTSVENTNFQSDPAIKIYMKRISKSPEHHLLKSTYILYQHKNGKMTHDIVSITRKNPRREIVKKCKELLF